MPQDSGTNVDAGTAMPDTGAAPSPDLGGAALPAPSITAITPSEGRGDGNTAVVIIGTGFVRGAEVRVGQIPMVDVEVYGSTTLNAVVPTGIKEGVYDVLVENPDGQAALLLKGYSVTDGSAAPTVDAGQSPAAPVASKGCDCTTQSSLALDAPALSLAFLLGFVALRVRRRRR